MDWKKKFKTPQLTRDTHRLVNGHVLPEDLIRKGGYNPEDFPVSPPPTEQDLLASMERIKELEKLERLKFHELSKTTKQN